MLKQSKGEIWVGLLGLPYAMKAQDIQEDGDTVTFTRLVEAKDGSKRVERITTRKEYMIFTSETLEVD
jgi:hypothetical protein